MTSQKRTAFCQTLVRCGCEMLDGVAANAVDRSAARQVRCGRTDGGRTTASG